MNELTDKTYCIVLRNNSKCYISPDKAEKLSQLLMEMSSHKFIKLEDRTLNTADIVEICPAEDVKALERKKQGDYQCQDGYWHTKGIECGHGLLRRYE